MDAHADLSQVMKIVQAKIFPNKSEPTHPAFPSLVVYEVLHIINLCRKARDGAALPSLPPRQRRLVIRLRSPVHDAISICEGQHALKRNKTSSGAVSDSRIELCCLCFGTVGAPATILGPMTAALPHWGDPHFLRLWSLFLQRCVLPWGHNRAMP